MQRRNYTSFLSTHAFLPLPEIPFTLFSPFLKGEPTPFPTKKINFATKNKFISFIA